MTRSHVGIMVLVLLCIEMSSASAQLSTESICHESRQSASKVVQRMIRDGLPNVKCSAKTGAVLWWGDPYDNTIAIGDMPIRGDYSTGLAVVKPREERLPLMPVCGKGCHNGSFPPLPKDKNPRLISVHRDIVPDPLNLQHGRASIWCLDCHHPTKSNKLLDNFGKPISFNEPQKLCGKCHGPAYRDWRDGIHGKRIGEWASDGKKRWFVCTECHNPHDVQQGNRNRGFAQLEPERAPELPKGLHNINH